MRIPLLALFTALLAAFAAPVFGNPTPGCMVSSQSSSSGCSSSRSSSSAGSIPGLTYGGGSKGSTPEKPNFDKSTYKSIKGAFQGKVSQPKKKGRRPGGK